MGCELVDNNSYWRIDLKWTPPIKWRNGRRIQLEDKAYDTFGMYRFERYYHLKNGPRELTYVGLAYGQSIGERVYEHPVSQLNYWKKKGFLWVSYAPLYITDGIHIKNRYEEAEYLLTYFCKPKEAMKKFKSIPHCHLHLRNTGWRGSIPKEIIFPTVLIK